MMRDNETHEARVRDALEAQRALAHAVYSAHTPDWGHLDLSMGQLKALMALAMAGDMNVSELADRLKTSKPSASILVDRLVQLGYTERREDQDDRRRTLVALTSEGRELAARLHRSGGERMAGWMAQMSADDLEALTRGLRTLTAIVSREGGSGGDPSGGDHGETAAVAPAGGASGRSGGAD